ncbi:MAG: type II CAAX endopeptidase family protein [Gemmatimonadales bacterium]
MDVAPLLKFFSLTFVVAWTCYIVAGALPVETGALRGALFLLGTISPSLVAIALTERAEGRPGTIAFLRGLFEKRVDPRWYLFAAFYMVAIKLTVALIHRAATGAWPRFGVEPWYIMVMAVVISTLVQAGEEIGWRGYALPRLTARMGLARASLLLGVIWASWHLPFFFIPAADTLGQSFPVYLLQVTALSVIVAWVFWRTQNLLPAMLLHAAVNNTKDIVPSAAAPASVLALGNSAVAWLTLALLWITASWLLGRMRAQGWGPGYPSIL